MTTGYKELDAGFIDWLIERKHIRKEKRDTFGMCLVFSNQDVRVPIIVPLTDDDSRAREPAELIRLLRADVGSYKMNVLMDEYLKDEKF